MDGVVKQVLNVIKKEIIDKEKKESKTPGGKKAILCEDCGIQAIVSIKPIQNGYRITLESIILGMLMNCMKMENWWSLKIGRFIKKRLIRCKKMRIKKLIIFNM